MLGRRTRLLPSAVTLCLLLLLAVLIPTAHSQAFVFKHSFSAPFQGNHIPFWSLGGGAYVDQGQFVRVTPARQSRSGYLWNTVPSQLAAWEVTIQLKVSGQPRLGGDGFAFWYVERPELMGTVYGSADFWTGLGIFFDTFNNDHRGSNPLITLQFNDGSQRYDAASDGESQALASCSMDFRNLAEPSFARITYKDGTLALDIALQSSIDAAGNRVPDAYQNCFTVDNLQLGADKYFGITAHTGDVADNHDVFAVTTRDLSGQASSSLEEVRKRYTEHLRDSHEHPDHVEMSQDAFQHEVLALLNQLQDAMGIIEQSQQAIGDLIAKTWNDNNDGGGSGGQHAGQVDTQSLMHLIQSINSKVDRVGGATSSGDLRNELNLLREEVFQRMQNNVRALDNTARNNKAEIMSALRQIEMASSSGSDSFGWMSFLMLLVTMLGVVFSSYKQWSSGKNDRFRKFLD